MFKSIVGSLFTSHGNIELARAGLCLFVLALHSSTMYVSKVVPAGEGGAAWPRQCLAPHQTVLDLPWFNREKMSKVPLLAFVSVLRFQLLCRDYGTFFLFVLAAVRDAFIMRGSAEINLPC